MRLSALTVRFHRHPEAWDTAIPRRRAIDRDVASSKADPLPGGSTSTRRTSRGPAAGIWPCASTGSASWRPSPPGRGADPGRDGGRLDGAIADDMTAAPDRLADAAVATPVG